MNNTSFHQKILYPVTRIRAAGAGGSGVLIYSRPDPKDKKRFINLVLTCQHVIDGCIKVAQEWEPVAQLERKIERTEEVGVEVFDYDGSKVVSSNSSQADIVAYDKRHDIALLKLHNFRQMPYVASMIPEVDISDLRIFEKTYVCGCSLLHDPFPGEGELTYLREVIEQKVYMMSSAPSIFGNSGGGLFRSSTGDLLGLTSRVTVTGNGGFGMDVQTWMEFSSHPSRFYEFLREQELHFVFDDKDDYYSAMARREKRKKDALRNLLMGSGDKAPEVPAEPE